MAVAILAHVSATPEQAAAAELEVGLRAGDPSYLQAGLDDAYAAFFAGQGEGSLSLGGGGSSDDNDDSGGGLGAPTLSFDTGDVMIARQVGGDFYATLRQALPPVGPLLWDASVTAAVGRRRYRLPQGIGILTDPAVISFTAASLTGRVSASWMWQMPRDMQVKLSASLGAELAYIRTHIRSALIDRPAITRHLSPVTGLAAELRWRRPQGISPVVRASVDLGAGRQVGFALGLGLQF